MNGSAIFLTWKRLRVAKHLFYEAYPATIWSRDLVCLPEIMHKQLDSVI